VVEALPKETQEVVPVEAGEENDRPTEIFFALLLLALLAALVMLH